MDSNPESKLGVQPVIPSSAADKAPAPRRSEQLPKPESIEILNAAITKDESSGIVFYRVIGTAKQSGNPDGAKVEARVMEFVQDFERETPEEPTRIKAAMQKPQRIFIRPLVRADGTVSDNHQGLIAAHHTEIQ